jgi:hypothetical protein
MPDSELLLYRSPTASSVCQCRLDGDTVWLNQRQLAELNQLGVGTVNHHIKAIFAEGELSPEATLRRYRIVQDLGSRQITREVDHFSLPLRTIPTAVAYALRTAFAAPRLWRAKAQRRKDAALFAPMGLGASARPSASPRPTTEASSPHNASLPPLRLCAFARSITPPRLATNAPPSRSAPPHPQLPNFFRLPLLHPLAA